MISMSALTVLVIFLFKFSIFQGLLSPTRNARFWPSTIVRFRNDLCQTLEGFEGTCYRKRQCRDLGGIGSGSCAKDIGTCCLFQASCGQSSSYNNTYFTNVGFPNTFSGSSSCSFTIQKSRPDICQVRLDFLNLNLAQPDGNGNCAIDALVVSGAASNTHPICGENSGQHVYLQFNGNNDIVVTISTSSSLTISRSWNIKAGQIACESTSLAPTGCLMYYSSVTGFVNSFNYGTTLSGSVINDTAGQPRAGTRQLVNQNYGVCVQMLPGYCSIEWSQGADPTSFTVTGNTALDAAVTPGLPTNGLVGENCTTDFIIVHNPSFSNNTAIPGDRFCGGQFPTITSSTKPFVLTVVTNNDDTTDVANRGFSLNFRQVPCVGNAGIFMLI